MQTKSLFPLLTLGVSLAAIPFAPSHALEVNTPNLYELNGSGIKIIYSTSSFDGSPRFTYQDRQQTLQFAGDQIQTVGLSIGTLVTVPIRRTVDTGSTTFSVLIPSVNLGETNQAKVVTDGITTTNRFNVIPKYNEGQRQFYQITHLEGTAQSVQF
ncbi:hypothetical protein [Nostoc sp. MS1]|uniref:hypothetical protein n=1 Tax=Nostoc sp. MS1 TaxID=2764711 RepID=UPI001CC550C2|nr:hypothetical protein [Nostoc sp. MS1]BCL39204.1 hypothetical protein NSMS1_56510 [Nostoc sp. MS1]